MEQPKEPRLTRSDEELIVFSITFSFFRYYDTMTNLFKTLEEKSFTTVRDLINGNQTLFLKKGLIESGVADGFSSLQGLQDELIVWDTDGNVFLVPVKSGVWFQPVIPRMPHNPTEGTIIASIGETQRTQHNPIATIRRTFGITTQSLANNRLYFYRAEHPDTEPFLNIHPLWLATDKFHELLARFPDANYSGLNTIMEVREPKVSVIVEIPPSRRSYPAPNRFPVSLDNKIA